MALNSRIDGFRSDAVIVGHNVVGFDLPFLKKRMIINRAKPCAVLERAMRAKPWDASIADTMLMWDASPQSRISLDKLCRVLGIESSKNGMDGSMVWDAYKEGRIAEIGGYCMRDIAATRACYERMTFA